MRNFGLAELTFTRKITNTFNMLNFVTTQQT